jgi:hypothetical protein
MDAEHATTKQMTVMPNTEAITRGKKEMKVCNANLEIERLVI